MRYDFFPPASPFQFFFHASSVCEVAEAVPIPGAKLLVHLMENLKVGFREVVLVGLVHTPQREVVQRCRTANLAELQIVVELRSYGTVHHCEVLASDNWSAVLGEVLKIREQYEFQQLDMIKCSVLLQQPQRGVLRPFRVVGELHRASSACLGWATGRAVGHVVSPRIRRNVTPPNTLSSGADPIRG